MITKTNNDTFELKQISQKEQLVFNMSERLDSDYLTFVLGFISSIVINDYCALTSFCVKDDVVSFVFMLCNAILLTIATLLLLNCTVIFSGLQKELFPFKTKESRLNYYKEKLAEQKAKILINRACLLCVFLIASIILDVIKFLYINM